MERRKYYLSVIWEFRLHLAGLLSLLSEYRLLLLFGLFLWHLLSYLSSGTHYFYAETKFNLRILHALKRVEFRPNFFLLNRTLSHIVMTKLKPIYTIPEHHKLVTEGGASITLASEPSSHIVIVVPGIAADDNSKYLQDIVKTLSQQGYCPAVYYNRFLSGHYKHPEQYLSLTDDLFSAIKLLKQHYPSSILLTAAVSYGSVQMLNYLAEINSKLPLQDSLRIQAAITFGTPFDFKYSERVMRNTVHGAAIHKFIAELTQTNRKAVKNGTKYIKIDWNKVDSAKDLRELDDALIAKFLNCRSAEEYYDFISPYGRMLDIDVPVVMYQSRDDAISPCETNPLREVQINKNLILVETDHGGHVTYLEGVSSSKPLVAVGRICAQYFNTLI